jgi:hypothetical protein
MACLYLYVKVKKKNKICPQIAQMFADWVEVKRVVSG